MDSIGKQFSSFGKNFQDSFKPWTARTGQYFRETLGQAGDKTELPPDYIALEARVDALKVVHQKMLAVTSQYTNEAYDYPSNLRESFNDLGRTVSEKVSLLSSATSPSEAAAAMTAPPQARPQPKTFSHAIARAALNSSQLLAHDGAAAAAGTTASTAVGAESGAAAAGGVEESLSQALEKYAIASEKVGEARLAQDAAIQARYLAGWNTTLNTNLQFAARARKGVEAARLNLDAVKARARHGGAFGMPSKNAAAGGGVGADGEGLSEEQRAEVEAAEDEFVSATEEAVGVMKNVLDTPEPLRNLAELIAAQLEYHKRSYEILSELAPAVDQLQVEQEASYRKSREGA